MKSLVFTFFLFLSFLTQAQHAELVNFDELDNMKKLKKMKAMAGAVYISDFQKKDFVGATQLSVGYPMRNYGKIELQKYMEGILLDKPLTEKQVDWILEHRPTTIIFKLTDTKKKKYTMIGYSDQHWFFNEKENLNWSKINNSPK